MDIETLSNNIPVQNVRAVVDIINSCNLRCDYCHPHLSAWTKQQLPLAHLEQIMLASEQQKLLEITMVGGEPTMHTEFTGILEAAHMLDKTTATFVTNATKVTPRLVREVRDSNVGRICVSVDGPDANSHNSRRGETLIQS